VFQVGLTQIVEHPALDATRQGIIDGLKEAGFEDGKQIKIDFQSAQGEQPIAQIIAQQFVADKKDLIIAIATPSAQAAVTATNEIPIVFSAVTDPVSAGLVASNENGEGNVTGTSDALPVDQQLALFEKLGIKVENLGIIYNAGEANSVASLEQAKAAAQELGMNVVEVTASNASEVQQAAQSLVGRVDGLYLMTDNTLAQAVQSVLAVANQNKIPTVSAVESYVEQGALVTLGLDYYKLGLETGKIAAEILNGKAPAEIPVFFMTDLSLVINAETAEELGLEIPEDVLKEAKLIPANE